MAPKEPTRQQISSRLAYSQSTPAFLTKLKNRIAGIPDEDDDDDEFEYDGSGRPPIPKRPAIPQRPDDDPGSADEDDGDERPQVVVLRAGKHLTEREAENERRKERGLPPLLDPESVPAADEPAAAMSSKDGAPKKIAPPSLSFSSTKAGPKASAGKRKAVGQPERESDDKVSGKTAKKKPKKASKALLSFGDDA